MRTEEVSEEVLRWFITDAIAAGQLHTLDLEALDRNSARVQALAQMEAGAALRRVMGDEFAETSQDPYATCCALMRAAAEGVAAPAVALGLTAAETSDSASTPDSEGA
jgi:hypothetical protein